MGIYALNRNKPSLTCVATDAKERQHWVSRLQICTQHHTEAMGKVSGACLVRPRARNTPLNQQFHCDFSSESGFLCYFLPRLQTKQSCEILMFL